MASDLAQATIRNSVTAVADNAVAEAMAYALAVDLQVTVQIGMTSLWSGLASEGRGAFEEEHAVIVRGLVDHAERRLALEDKSGRRALCLGSRLLQVPWHAKLPSGRVCITKQSLPFSAATEAPQTGWPGGNDAFGIPRLGVFLAPIQVVERQGQERDDGGLLASTVDERILEGVGSGLHGSKTSSSCAERTMESLGKPASAPSPPPVVFVGVEVCRSHGRDDQIDGLAAHLTDMSVPNDLASWSTPGAESAQVVCLDAILVHGDGCRLATETIDASSASVEDILTGLATATTTLPAVASHSPSAATRDSELLPASEPRPIHDDGPTPLGGDELAEDGTETNAASCLRQPEALKPATSCRS